MSASAKDTSTPFTSIGGQAVIEGVMMRSPGFVAVAVRKPDGKIVLKSYPFESIAKRISLFRKPMIRGVVTLLESMVQGMKMLGYSAQIAESPAGSTETKPLKSDLAIAGSMVFAIGIGLILFVALPHALTAVLTSPRFLGVSPESAVFHLLDGGFKLLILLGYVYAISRMEEIRRVFQYHGAEHKAIYAFEAGKPLTVEEAQKFTTLHPRCGTSFLLFLVLISVLVFSVLFPILGIGAWSRNPWVNHLAMIGIKMVLMLPVAGISYEFIKACSLRMNSPLFRMLIAPGLALQKLTTQPPDGSQLEVALASLKQVLALEKGNGVFAREIAGLSDIESVTATVSEFPER